MATISERGVKAEYYRALRAYTGNEWIDQIATRVLSDNDFEEYSVLGMPPALREWVGERQSGDIGEEEFRLDNVDYEASFTIKATKYRRANGGQLLQRIASLATRGQEHWGVLASALIVNGNAAEAMDGQYFFDTDHVTGSSGTQDNDLTAAITDADVPTSADLATHSMKAIQAMLGFKDDQGQPMNAGLNRFVIMGPTNFFTAGMNMVSKQYDTQGRINDLVKQGMTVDFMVNPRLTDDDVFYVFAAGMDANALVLQGEKEPMITTLMEGSEYATFNNRYFFGVDASRSAGYGYWQNAVRYQFTDA